MCGIVGYIGERDATAVLLDGLGRLEYRGYDSAGIAVPGKDGRLSICKTAGRVAALDAAVREAGLNGHSGIGHTRWATHGAPTTANAHPHADASGGIAIVHNGIIENYEPLREELRAQGITFRSQTDTEVIPHLIARSGGTVAGVLEVIARLEGSFALALLSGSTPDEILAVRRGSPLLIGLGEGEIFLASDAPALLPYTHRVIYLPEDHVARLRASGAEIFDASGQAVTLEPVTLQWDWTAADKGSHAHFMLKEIHEQPDVLRRLVQDYARTGLDLPLSLERVPERVLFVACGTAWHAGLVGRGLVERWARIPSEAEFASEFRYGERPLSRATLVVAISQSGETADTLAGVRLAREAGARVLAVVNVPESSIAREADDVIYTNAGPEVGVASTKAYTAQLTVMALLALSLARARGGMGDDAIAPWLSELRAIPARLDSWLSRADQVRALAHREAYHSARNAMFIGRGIHYPTALEGALKLKEISYIHVEGYAAGEMKHGPIALVSDGLPVVAVAVPGQVYEKTISNIEELRARGARLLAVGMEGDTHLTRHVDDLITIPRCAELLSPLLAALPLQLFAYHVACALGQDVDRPRNLAKSVTVE